MFKKLILLVSLTFSFLLFSQEENLSPDDLQQNYFTEGHTAMKNHDFNHAYTLFSLAQNFGTDKEIKDNSLKKTDSLKIILREKLTKKIIGNWKMLTDESWAIRSDSIVAKMITIEPDRILFYELYDKAKKWNLIKTEKLIFSEKPNMSFDPLLFVYSNKEVWSYSIDEISEGLKVYYIGEEYETGISEIVCGNTEIKYFKLQ